MINGTEGQIADFNYFTKTSTTYISQQISVKHYQSILHNFRLDPDLWWVTVIGRNAILVIIDLLFGTSSAAIKATIDSANNTEHLRLPMMVKPEQIK